MRWLWSALEIRPINSTTIDRPAGSRINGLKGRCSNEAVHLLSHSFAGGMHT